LGVEAQRETLARFAEGAGLEIVGEYVEVETGKGSDALDRRPQLAAAVAKARALRCSVAVAKLDRLSRDVIFASVKAMVRPACWYRLLNFRRFWTIVNGSGLGNGARKGLELQL
jgi:DNA invertase Pin-like site-specific DNA recombinase